MNDINVKQLFIHPIKGLTPQAENTVDLHAGHGIRGDRAFALMYNTAAPSDRAVVPWMKKTNFAMQCALPALAALKCDYNFQTDVLSVKRQGIELLATQTRTQAGRDLIGAFFTSYLAAVTASGSSLRLVGDGNGTSRYPDRIAVHLSLVSQASLNQLSDLVGQHVDVRRFRPNVVLDGVPAWGEFDWVGQQLQIGSATLEITAPINRCLNINVNPDTGESDLPLLELLQQHFRHRQTGVVAKVIRSGTVKIGDRLQLLN